MAIRYARWALWTVVIGVAIIAAALGWVLTSQAALNWAIDRLSAAAGGRLVIDGVQRTGIVALVAERVRYTDPALKLEVRDASIDVQFAPLLRGRVVVRSLAARHVDVETTPTRDDEALALPQSLALPLPLDVQSLRVGRFAFGSEGKPIVLAELEGGWIYDGNRHAVTLRTLRTPWAAVQGRLELGASRPFPIEGGLSIVPSMAQVGVAHVAVAGELGAMGVGAVGQAYGAAIAAKASLSAFGTSALVWIDVKASGFETRALDASLPRARLDASANARIERDGTLSGHLDVVNHNPGLPATERMPIVRLQGRFAGGGQQWTLSDLVLDGGLAGRLTGQARITAGSADAQLRAHALNLVGLHESLYPTAFAGPIRVARSNGKIDFEVDLKEASTQIVLAGVYAGSRIDLSQARWNGPAGGVDAQGMVTLSERIAFEAKGRLIGFDPARVGAFPPARLNAQFVAKGQVRPLMIDVDATFADSRFRDQPLAGKARASVQPDRIRNAVIDLRLGRARAQAYGNFGAPGDRLTFDVEVPNARLIHPDARGRLRVVGDASGTFRAPTFRVELNAADLRYGERFGVGEVSGKAALADGGAGRVDVDLSARALRFGDSTLTQATVVVEGTRARHVARVSTRASDHRLEAGISGGLDERFAWTGLLQTVRVEGSLPLRLEQPVELRLSTKAVHVGRARIDVGKTGHIDLAFLDWDRQRGVTSRGALSQLSLAALRPLLPIPDAVRSLVVAGQWDVAMAETLAGSLSLSRQSGDIVIPVSPPIPAKLRTLRVEARAQGSEISVDANIESEVFGQATVTAATRAERRGGQWGIAGEAPLQAHVQADMPSLDWARPFLGDSVSIAGRAEMMMRASGTFARPAYEGHVRAQGLSARVPDLGLTLRDGTMNAIFDGQRLSIESLRFASEDGQVVGTGGARLVSGDLSAQIALTAQKLTVLARPDRLAVVSGKLDVAWDPRGLKAKGQFTADRGVVELPREDTPRPSSDVIVLGAQPRATRELNVEADLSVDLGQNFSLRGKGLATRLAGTLRAQVHPKAGISLTGTVRAVDGTYTAFGRELTIRRGTLTFAGPLDNPSLDILAVRVVSDVEVGVAVGGTALVPQVRLVSTPSMSDANKLAWLTLGHGLDEAGKNEAAVMQAAALALLSRGSTDGKGTLASRFGLDELSLGTASGTGERIVSIGKRFASNFYVGFEHGITGAAQVIKITYDLSRRWSVQARAGSENAVDLFYTLGFR